MLWAGVPENDFGSLSVAVRISTDVNVSSLEEKRICPLKLTIVRMIARRSFSIEQAKEGFFSRFVLSHIQFSAILSPFSIEKAMVV